jgi:hypothetical protein
VRGERVILDINDRPAEPPPPARNGHRTADAGRRNGMPAPKPYVYRDGETVLSPAEIVQRLREEIAARAGATW